MVSAIIVAAGKGTRMGPLVDKLFLEVNGRPIIAHTWQRFEDAQCIDEIVLVVRAGMESEFETLARRYGFKKPFRMTVGGRERQDSVWNGLNAVSNGCEVVAIQDGARPCTTPGHIAEVVSAAREAGAAVAAQRLTDTIKESGDGLNILRTVDRSRLWSVQTPQAFRLEVICRALSDVRDRGMAVTDDTAACELIGQAVRLVEGKAPNPKATSPADLPFLEVVLRAI
jgi:2-C-methyl-D-erythritol 4-phosphate cytidylyltransferase